MSPELKFVRANGVKLAYFERGDRREDAPTLLFVHATGFHGRIWDYHAAAFPDLHIIALEQRGHGRSEKVAISNWRTMGEDQAAFVDALGLTRLIGVAHSMGAHAMIDAAAISGAFARLLLLDPTLSAPEDYSADYANAFGDQLHPAAKRRNEFASADEMLEQIRHKSSFPLFHPQILRDYCEHGLLQVESGGFVLACPPEIEARVYMAARSNGAVFDSVRQLEIPVTVVRGKRPAPGQPGDFSSSPTWPELADQFANGTDIHWADCSHFIPMERPDDVIELIRAQVDAWQRAAAG